MANPSLVLQTCRSDQSFPWIPLGFAKLLLNVVFCESPSFGSQHIRQFVMAPSNLVPNWHQTIGEMVVVLLQKLIGYHEIVNIPKHESPFAFILPLCFEETQGMVAPVTTWVQVM